MLCSGLSGGIALGVSAVVISGVLVFCNRFRPSPTPMVDIHWDLSRGRSYQYVKEQRLPAAGRHPARTLVRFDGQDGEVGLMTMRAFKGETDEAADGMVNLVMRDDRKRRVNDAKELKQQYVKMLERPVFLDCVRTRGPSVFELSGMGLADASVPLPDVPLRVGESREHPAVLAANLNGSIFHARGRSTLTLESVSMESGHHVARVRFSMKVDGIDVPDEVRVTVNAHVSTVGYYLWDLDDNCLLRMSSSQTQQMEMKMLEMPDEFTKQLGGTSVEHTRWTRVQR
jgi:hypothetical protein